MSGFTYPEVGGTFSGADLPGGYNHLRRRMRVGSGERAFETAAAAVVEWRMHAGMRVRPAADRTRAEPGGRVVLTVGVGRLSLRAPCEVVWTVDEPRRRGFAYGSLPGHPERGEESFIVDWDETDAVWLTITAFSTGGRWFARLAAPLVPLAQNSYALCCGMVLRRLVRSAARRVPSDG
jgi:uncharacterized protein (UPF0548 family)